MKLALVHDWLNQRGGAEDVLEVLNALYPDAPIYTSIYDRKRMPSAYREWDVRTLWMNNLPGIHQNHQPYLPLYPLAWGNLNLSAYDVILSNKSGFAHGLQHDENTLHISYCLTPTRYVWQFDTYLKREGYGKLMGNALRPLIAALRFWDFTAARGVHHFIAISHAIETRIKTYYHRDSDVIFPPVETERFSPAPTHDDYFLCVSRLIPYKRIDLAIQAANQLQVPLKIAGAGRDIEALKAKAGPTVEFLGYVPDEDLNDLIAHAKAFVFPGLEDFGIAPVQAMAAGRPVIAFGGGGALDYVVPGKTGMLFEHQTVESLAEAMAAFDPAEYDPQAIQQFARRFDRDVFEQEITSYIEQAHDAFIGRRPFHWQRPSHPNTAESVF